MQDSRAPDLSLSTTLELRRPGDEGRNAGLSSPRHHSEKLGHDPEVALLLASSYGNRRARKPSLFLSQKGH